MNFTEMFRFAPSHRHLDSPFEQIGQADITMHVDWTSLAHRAEANGLRVAGLTDQHHFLTGIVSELGRGGSPESPAGDWVSRPYLIRPKPNARCKRCCIPKCSVAPFRCSRSPRMSGPTCRLCRVSNSRMRRASRWVSEIQISKTGRPHLFDRLREINSRRPMLVSCSIYHARDPSFAI